MKALTRIVLFRIFAANALELHPGGAVLTLDADFRYYRLHGNKVIPVLMPES